jgi:hypothetical protein
LFNLAAYEPFFFLRIGRRIFTFLYHSLSPLLPKNLTSIGMVNFTGFGGQFKPDSVVNFDRILPATTRVLFTGLSYWG